MTTAVLPDGRTLEFPDETDPAVIQATVKKMIMAQPSVTDSINYQQTAKDTPTAAVPLVAAGKFVDRKVQGVKQMIGMGTDQTQGDAAYAALQQQHPFLTFMGEAAPTLAMKNPLVMAATAALDYGSPSERAANAVGAGVGGAIGTGAGKVIGRAMGGPRSMSGVASDVGDFVADNGSNKFGIPLTVGQATQSRIPQILESVISNLPGGGAVNAARTASFSGFNKAVGNTFGSDATALTPEVLGQFKSSIGKQIGDIAKRNTLQVDAPLISGLEAAKQRAAQELTPDQAKIVNNQVQQIYNKIGTDLSMPGTLYQAFDTNLGKMMKGNQGTISDVLGDVRQSLRNSFDSSISDADSAAWQLSRKQYANLQTVAKAAAATPDGTLSPAKLLQQVNIAQPNAKFGSGTDLAELAQWAKGTLPDKIPNSGTVQRAFWQKALTNPLATAGTVGGAAYGANEAGISPTDMAGAAMLPFLVGRGLAAKPISAVTSNVLQSVGRSSVAESLARALRGYATTS